MITKHLHDILLLATVSLVDSSNIISGLAILSLVKWVRANGLVVVHLGLLSMPAISETSSHWSRFLAVKIHIGLQVWVIKIIV